MVYMLRLSVFCTALFAAVPSQSAETSPKASTPTVRVARYDVGSRVKNPDDLGGFWKSKNYPNRITSNFLDEIVAKPNDLSVVAHVIPPTANSEKATAEQHLEIFVVNRTTSRKSFSAQDSLLNLRQEAKDSAGNWKPIEYLESSWCGNSYHTVYLGPNSFWKLEGKSTPGPFKTALRYALEIGNGKTIYSNEFDGSIFESQFTKPEPPTDAGLINPTETASSR